MPWHPPCALVRLIFACYSYSPKTSTSTDTRCSLLPCQVRITTVFTLPISTNSDWNLPWLPLKALFVFPTFSLCSFQGALKSLPYALSIVSPILQNDTVFHQCQKHQICSLFRALNSSSLSLCGICTTLFLHPHFVSSVRMLDLGCGAFIFELTISP